MTVLLAGCGDLGTEAGLRFLAAGHRVLGLRRSAELLPPEFDAQAVDLARQVPDLPADIEIVVFATTADERTVDAYRAGYLDTLTNTLDGLRRAGARPRRALFVSSTSVYGIDDGRWVDENTPTERVSKTGAVLLDTEAALQRRLPGAMVLRLSGIYGPGRTGVIDQVRRGTAIVPENIRHTNRIHRDDAAAAIVHLTTQVDAPAPIYLGVDDEPVQRAEFLRFLAEELGVDPPPVGAAGPARGGDKRCSNARLRATGFEFAYPTYRQGYRAILAGKGNRHP